VAHTDPKTLKAQTIANLESQRTQALANNDSKTAALIQKIIDLLAKPKK
jgi:hypothetical protein